MALFSRRTKSSDDAVAGSGAADRADRDADAVVPDAPDAAEPDPVPTIGISVQAFRGVGAEAGPAVAPPVTPDAAASALDSPMTVPSRRGSTSPGPSVMPPVPTSTPAERRLPLAPTSPPEQTETVAGMKDNVLLREALRQIEAGATNEQLLGVLRQTLQGHLYIRVIGDARAQISEGKPLEVAVVRDEERQFMLAFSSAGAVRDSVKREADAATTSAVAQPSTSVLQQVVAGDFAGLILDNASAPHRVVFPTELLQKALDQADPEMKVKSIVAAPREQDSAVRVGQVIAGTRMWVAVSDGDGTGQPGVAEAQTADGRRFLQIFSHPLEVIALGRGDRPLPFTPQQLAAVLASHPEMAGVIVDSAGPSIVLERDALEPVLAVAEEREE